LTATSSFCRIERATSGHAAMRAKDARGGGSRTYRDRPVQDRRTCTTLALPGTI
jgi:hypothetical protein